MSRADQIRAAFEEFHRANPQVYKLFVKFAFHAIEAGQTRWSADAILHVIRWEVVVRTRRTDGFKINNNHSAYYARKFAEDHPDHEDFFASRELISQGFGGRDDDQDENGSGGQAVFPW